MTKLERKHVAGELRRWAFDVHDTPTDGTMSDVYAESLSTKEILQATEDEAVAHILSVAEAVKQGCWP